MCRISRRQIWSTSRIAQTLEKVPVVGNYFKLMQAVSAADEIACDGKQRGRPDALSFLEPPDCKSYLPPEFPRCKVSETAKTMCKDVTIWFSCAAHSVNHALALADV